MDIGGAFVARRLQLKRARRMALAAQRGQGGDPAQRLHLPQAPIIHDDGGRHAEADQVGQGSSCAPKRLSAPRMRAARPSSMSKIMAMTTKETASVQPRHWRSGWR